jgi:hypothetical protein
MDCEGVLQDVGLLRGPERLCPLVRRAVAQEHARPPAQEY